MIWFEGRSKPRLQFMYPYVPIYMRSEIGKYFYRHVRWNPGLSWAKGVSMDSSLEEAASGIFSKAGFSLPASFPSHESMKTCKSG